MNYNINLDILFESSKNIENHYGVFVLWLTSSSVPVKEHVDRICSVLDIESADRRKFRVDYLNFVNKQPKNSYIKFSLKLSTQTNTVVVSPDSPRLSRSNKVLIFEEIERWDTNGEVKTCAEIIDHFNLKSLSIVNTSTPNNGSQVSSPLLTTSVSLAY